jgi:hypothetical protein
VTENKLGLVGAVGIELKAVLKTRKLLILLNDKKRQKHRMRPSEVHAGYTGRIVF